MPKKIYSTEKKKKIEKVLECLNRKSLSVLEATAPSLSVLWFFFLILLKKKKQKKKTYVMSVTAAKAKMHQSENFLLLVTKLHRRQ